MERVSRAKKRADRIRAEVPIQRVLADYGYQVDAAYDGEQQFGCDLHGDGMDNKPSARVYPISASWYCFSCDRSRDAIETVREKEGMDFWAALKALETRHNLPALPWDDDDRVRDYHLETKPQGAVAQVAAALDPTKTFADDQRVVERHLLGLTADRDPGTMEGLLKFWEQFDAIAWMVRMERWPEETGRARLQKLRIEAGGRA